MASSKRERELARMRAERQAARRAAAEARRRQRRRSILSGIAALAVIGLIALVAITVGGDDKKDPVDTLSPATGASGASGTTGPTGAGTCTYTKSGASSKPIKGTPPSSGVVTTGVRKAVLVTSRGTVEANLLASKAPCTVNSFGYLAAQKYLDGTDCHRLTTSGIFVLQCGDPTGTGTGGPGYAFADENLTGATYPKGTLAMANSGPGTNGSQFFIVYKDTQLPPSYTPFGTVTKGLDIVEKVAAAGAAGGADGKPKQAISLKTVTVA